MSFAGAANIQDGVTIDLGALNEVQVFEDRRTTAVGAGARWGNVSSKLDAMGLAVVGGRVDKVGVGGLTLGGELAPLVSVQFLYVDEIRRRIVFLSAVRLCMRQRPEL